MGEAQRTGEVVGGGTRSSGMHALWADRPAQPAAVCATLAALAGAGPLSPGHVGEDTARSVPAAARARGSRSQRPEYVGKRLAAEAFLAYGSALGGDDARAPLGVSVPMLPVPVTRSRARPMLRAAIRRAPSCAMARGLTRARELLP